MEVYCQELEEENKDLKKMFIDVNKSQITFEKIQKLNESLKSDVDKLKKENAGLKNLNVQKKNSITEIEKDDREKLNLLKTSVSRIESLESLLNEKDIIINEGNIKIQDLLQTLDKKEHEIKSLIKMSQNCDQENKNNVEEITKQANTTIKLFYSSVTGDSNLNSDVTNIKNKESIADKNNKPLFYINADLVKEKSWIVLFDEVFTNIITGVPGLTKEAQEK